MLIVGFGTFILSFIGALFLWGWLIARVVAPEAPWWDVLHTSFNALMISFVAAMAITAGALRLLNQIHYRRGAYPCPFCGKPQRGFAITCDCPDAKTFRSSKENENEHAA